jgi:class 3 adenylate cyclase
MLGLIERALQLKLDSDGITSKDANTTLGTVAAAVAEQRPDLAEQTASDGTVTLLFSDIVAYTVLLDRLGDVAAHQLIQEHNGIVRALTRSNGGHEVELRGDGFLLAFADPAQSLRCAIALQRAFADRNGDAAEPIRIRIGLHTGETIRDADTFFGKSVVAAFRVADMAEGEQILVTDSVRDELVANEEFAFDEGREVDLKGFEDSRTVYAVSWRQ